MQTPPWAQCKVTNEFITFTWYGGLICSCVVDVPPHFRHCASLRYLCTWLVSQQTVYLTWQNCILRNPQKQTTEVLWLDCEIAKGTKWYMNVVTTKQEKYFFQPGLRTGLPRNIRCLTQVLFILWVRNFEEALVLKEFLHSHVRPRSNGKIRKFPSWIHVKML